MAGHGDGSFPDDDFPRRRDRAARMERLAAAVLHAPPIPLARTGKIYSVNMVQFWSTPKRAFAALGRLLKPGGRIATTYMPRAGKDKAGQLNARARTLERLMRDNGFEQPEMHWMPLRPTPAFCLAARK